jgi:hypothetical protein
MIGGGGRMAGSGEMEGDVGLTMSTLKKLRPLDETMSGSERNRSTTDQWRARDSCLICSVMTEGR